MIYKVFRADEYTDFIVDGETKGAPVDLKDGYIHFSTLDQLEGTLAKHFEGEGELYLLSVDETKLDNLKWEKSRGGALFPHLYAPLLRENVVDVHELDGHKLPRGLG